MEFTQDDYREAEDTHRMLTNLDRLESEETEELIDDVYSKQPFLVSLILGYKTAFREERSVEITKLILLVYQYFELKNLIGEEQITPELFERKQQKNISLAEYAGSDADENEKVEKVTADILGLKSIVLLACVWVAFDAKKPLMYMSMDDQEPVLMALKSLIECFEELSGEK